LLQARTVQTGDPYSVWQVTRLLEGAGRTDEALAWLQTLAAETGDSYVRGLSCWNE
jgi:hypothetical protein